MFCIVFKSKKMVLPILAQVLHHPESTSNTDHLQRSEVMQMFLCQSLNYRFLQTMASTELQVQKIDGTPTLDEACLQLLSSSLSWMLVTI